MTVEEKTNPYEKAKDIFKTLEGYTFNDVKWLTKHLMRLAETSSLNLSDKK